MKGENLRNSQKNSWSKVGTDNKVHSLTHCTNHAHQVKAPIGILQNLLGRITCSVCELCFVLKRVVLQDVETASPSVDKISS